MTIENNKSLVAEWFNAIWGEHYNPDVIEKLADDKIVMQYPIHGRREGKSEVKGMLDRLRAAFPDLKFRVVGPLIAEGDYVVGRWAGGGTHTGPEFKDLPAGILPENSGKEIAFTGMTVFRIEDNLIVEELGEEDALKAGLQLEVIQVAAC